jgi:hypothetical protein
LPSSAVACPDIERGASSLTTELESAPFSAGSDDCVWPDAMNGAAFIAIPT